MKREALLKLNRLANEENTSFDTARLTDGGLAQF
jgi:hypothetical protein